MALSVSPNPPALRDWNGVEAIKSQRSVVCRTSSITNMRLPQSCTIGGRAMSQNQLRCVITLGLVAPDMISDQGWQPYGDNWSISHGLTFLCQKESFIMLADCVSICRPEKPIPTGCAFIRAQRC